VRHSEQAFLTLVATPAHAATHRRAGHLAQTRDAIDQRHRHQLIAKNRGSLFAALFDVGTVEACWYRREVIWKNNICPVRLIGRSTAAKNNGRLRN
jgi:hypothetical protein